MFASLVASLVPGGQALADPPPWAPAHGKRAKDARYDSHGRYYNPPPIGYDDRIWRGDDGKYYCKRDNGTTGLIIGGAVGALVGRELDGGRERTVGTIVGASAGALLGQAIARGELRCQ